MHNCDRIALVIVMLFEKKKIEHETNYNELRQELEYKSKFGFLDELKCSVRTDEEYAKFKGYID